MNPGHIKGVHDVNEVTFLCLMNFAFRKVHFLSMYSPPQSDDLLLPVYSSFVHIIMQMKKRNSEDPDPTDQTAL